MHLNKLVILLSLFFVNTLIAQKSVYETKSTLTNTRTNEQPTETNSTAIGEFKQDILWFFPSTHKEGKKFERVELAVKIPKKIDQKISHFLENNDTINGINPFLEWQYGIKAVFTNVQTGTKIEKDGFYYNNFSRDTTAADFRAWKWIRESTPTHTRIRFAAPQTGQWECQVYLNTRDTSITYQTFDFNVSDSDNKGYVSMGESRRFFTLEEDTYFPSGQNIIAPRCEFCYSNSNGQLPSETGKPAQQAFESWMDTATVLKSFLIYQSYMKSLAASGGNYFREILLPQCQDIEWERLGNYYGRQNRAWELDEQVFLAEELGLKIQLNLQIQIALERAPDRMKWNWTQDIQDKKWKTAENPCSSPYNREISTTLNRDPNTFFSDATAKKFYKQKLRYIIARWGYSTSIGMWGMVSEIQTPCTDNATCVSWMEEMGDYLKRDLKINQILTPSFLGVFHDAKNYENLILKSEFYDNIPLNWYSVSATKYQGVPRITEGMKEEFDRPFFYGEIGNSDLFGCDLYQYEWIRDAWMTAFSGTAGVGLNWDYHFVDSLRKHLGHIREFTEGIDFDGNGNPWTPRRVISDNRKAETVYLISPDENYAIGVISNRFFNWYLYADEKGELPQKCYNYIPNDPGFDATKEPSQRGVWERTYSESPNNYIDNVNSNSKMNDSINYAVFESFGNEDGKGYRLRLYDLNVGNYKMDFYNALTMEYLGTKSNWGPDVRLEYPELTRYAGLIAFKLYLDPEDEFINAENAAE